MYICFATMGFTNEDRYLPLPTHRTLKVLYFAKREYHRLTVTTYVMYNISLDFSQQDYQVQSATEVHVGLLRAPATRLSFDSACDYNFLC